MPGGCCGGPPEGLKAVYQLHRPGKATEEFDTQADAFAAQRAAGGAGRVQKIFKRLPAAK